MKYDNEHHEHIHRVSGESAVSEGGHVDSPYGWFALVRLDAVEDRAALEHYGAEWIVIRETSDGSVPMRFYDGDDAGTKAQEHFALLERGHALWEAEITDEQIKEAIDNYLQAALFTATDEKEETLEGYGYAWSEAAQKLAREEVTDFVIQNAEDCKAFVDTGRPWAQVGIDFSLTRNGHGAGFWDRGAGEVGQALTDAAHAWGGTTVYLNDNQELEFS